MRDFDEARRAALMVDIVRSLRKIPSDLLPFDAVREKLRLLHTVERGVEEVPLDRIVGSLGREREFNRVFLPRQESLRSRWQQIRRVAEGLKGFRPVDLYKVGDAYFVRDGHHRVSVVRALGAPAIEANVREFITDVPIGPNDSISNACSITSAFIVITSVSNRSGTSIGPRPWSHGAGPCMSR